MGADAAREWSRDVTVIQIEPGVPNQRLRVINGRLVRPLVRSPLVGVLNGAKAGSL